MYQRPVDYAEVKGNQFQLYFSLLWRAFRMYESPDMNDIRRQRSMDMNLS